MRPHQVRSSKSIQTKYIGIRMKVLLLNDTRVGNHFGCEIVVSVILDELKLHGAKAIKTVPSLTHNAKIMSIFVKFRPNIVIINAEGTFHDEHFGIDYLVKAIEKICDNHVSCVLINGTFQNLSDKCLKVLSRATKIYCRDHQSVQYLSSKSIHSFYCPDLVISQTTKSIEESHEKRKIDVLLTDAVDKPNKFQVPYNIQDNFIVNLGATIVCPSVTFSIRQRLGILKRAWKKITRRSTHSWSAKDAIHKHQISSFIITRRYHSVCLAIFLERPFLAGSSNTSKIENLLTDIQLLHRSVPQQSQISSSDLKLFTEQEIAQCRKFKSKARELKKSMFMGIREIVD